MACACRSTLPVHGACSAAGLLTAVTYACSGLHCHICSICRYYAGVLCCLRPISQVLEAASGGLEANVRGISSLPPIPRHFLVVHAPNDPAGYKVVYLLGEHCQWVDSRDNKACWPSEGMTGASLWCAGCAHLYLKTCVSLGLARQSAACSL
jgi:hypothetical protein